MRQSFDDGDPFINSFHEFIRTHTPRQPFRSRIAFDRPADTTAYSANEAVNMSTPSLLEFMNVTRSPGKPFVITNIYVSTSFAAATAASWQLFLFDRPVLSAADNAAWSPTKEDMVKCLGMFTAATIAKTGTSGVYRPSFTQELAGRTFDGFTSLWGVLTTLTAWTPGSADRIIADISGFNYG